MSEMSTYCKAFLVERLEGFDGWEPNLANLRQESAAGDEAPERVGLAPDDVLYLHENFVVTDGIYPTENIIFDKVTDLWKTFCSERLHFEVPVYEPIEVPDDDRADGRSASESAAS